MRGRADCAHVLAANLDSVSDSPAEETARSLLTAMMERADDPRQAALRARDTERLARQRDREIAAASGPSAHGVCHHTPKLFAKLGARNRAGAVRRAQGMGMLAGDF